VSVHQRKRREAKKIARERIDILFKMAERMAEIGEEALADRYVALILEISKKYRIRLPTSIKRRICKKCRCFIVPGRNARVRVKKGRVIIYCQKCGRIKRIPFK